MSSLLYVSCGSIDLVTRGDSGLSLHGRVLSLLDEDSRATVARGKGCAKNSTAYLGTCSEGD